MNNFNGTLFIVSTPIGNMEDISLRAVRILKEADIIAAEDTRRAQKIMQAYDIKNEVISYHSYNARAKTKTLIEILTAGKNVALISDSGTPGISDPGNLIIRQCIEEGITVTAVPGPAALITALILSGKRTDKFVFEGFLSNKGAKRKKKIKQLLGEDRTVIVYESPHRIEKFLNDLKELDEKREIVIARELTKKFEEILRGSAGTLLKHFSEHGPKGEMIVIF